MVCRGVAVSEDRAKEFGRVVLQVGDEDLVALFVLEEELGCGDLASLDGEGAALAVLVGEPHGAGPLLGPS